MAENKREINPPDYGGKIGHAIFHLLIKTAGVYPAYALAAFIMPYYVLLLKKPRKSASHYLRQKFPEAGAFKILLLSMLYFFEFSKILIDQAAMGILGRKKFRVQFNGWQNLLEIAQSKKGLILLTSHIGAWQYSMASMFNLGIPVHFNLHIDEQTTGRHFFDLADQKELFHIISPSAFLGGMVEMTNALLKGECVCIMGDRAYGAKTRKTMFLRKEAEFPISPYHLVTQTKTNLVSILTRRTGKLSYSIEISEITKDINLEALSRDEAIEIMLKKYAVSLEKFLAKNPFSWLNFFNFWKSENSEDI